MNTALYTAQYADGTTRHHQFPASPAVAGTHQCPHLGAVTLTPWAPPEPAPAEPAPAKPGIVQKVWHAISKPGGVDMVQVDALDPEAEAKTMGHTEIKPRRGFHPLDPNSIPEHAHVWSDSALRQMETARALNNPPAPRPTPEPPPAELVALVYARIAEHERADEQRRGDEQRRADEQRRKEEEIANTPPEETLDQLNEALLAGAPGMKHPEMREQDRPLRALDGRQVFRLHRTPGARWPATIDGWTVLQGDEKSILPRKTHTPMPRITARAIYDFRKCTELDTTPHAGQWKSPSRAQKARGDRYVSLWAENLDPVARDHLVHCLVRDVGYPPSTVVKMLADRHVDAEEANHRESQKMLPPSLRDPFRRVADPRLVAQIEASAKQAVIASFVPWGKP